MGLYHEPPKKAMRNRTFQICLTWNTRPSKSNGRFGPLVVVSTSFQISAVSQFAMYYLPISFFTCRLVLHSAQFVATRDDLVGRAPWPAADPLVGHLRRVYSSLWLRLCCLVGQAILPAAAFQAALGCG